MSISEDMDKHCKTNQCRQCPGCNVVLLGVYFEMCSKIYEEFNGNITSIQYEAKKIISQASLDDLEEFQKIWILTKDSYLPTIPIKERVSLRRGFDILTVESLSTY